MIPNGTTHDSKSMNIILLPSVTPQFRFRKPRRMIQFSTDPRLDCYEVAGPLPRFPYSNYVSVEEPMPDDLEDEKESPEPMSTKDSSAVLLTNAPTVQFKQSKLALTAPIGIQPKQPLFNFCAANSNNNTDLENAPTVPLPSKQNHNYTKKGLICGAVKCSVFEVEDSKFITDENKCPTCSQEPIQNTKHRNNYTLQKKRIFWEIWAQARDKARVLPTVSFEDTFRTYRYEDKDAWYRIVQNVFMG